MKDILQRSPPDFLRNPDGFFISIRDNEEVGLKAWTLTMASFLFLMAYGFTLAFTKSPLQAVSSSIKMPILFLSTMAFSSSGALLLLTGAIGDAVFDSQPGARRGRGLAHRPSDATLDRAAGDLRRPPRLHRRRRSGRAAAGDRGVARDEPPPRGRALPAAARPRRDRCDPRRLLRRDLWPEVARVDARRQLHVVVAQRSFVWQPGDRARLAAIAAQNPGVRSHDIDAGHWLHVDAPDALRALLGEAISRSAAPG